MDKENNAGIIKNQADLLKTGTPSAPAIVSENAAWSLGETEVAATITRPDGKSIHPAVVLVAGSGPTDRDWNSPLLPGTNGSARLLAEELAGIGFVTIRYDKRVTGPNAQKNLPLLTGRISMDGHVDELAGAISLLRTRPDVNPDKVFVLGNSEGTIHALHYQLTRQPQLAGLILVGMPGCDMAHLMRTQIEAQLAPLPNAQAVMAGYDKLMADFLAGNPFVADPALPEGINDLFKGFNTPINLPFARELFLLDPAALLVNVTAPVLVMIGKKDIQVDFILDGRLLELAAKGHENTLLSYPENADHVLKYEPRLREVLSGADALAYNDSSRVLDPEALQVIKNWLLNNS